MIHNIENQRIVKYKDRNKSERQEEKAHSDKDQNKLKARKRFIYIFSSDGAKNKKIEMQENKGT